jgi:hypothetical protein
MDAEGTRTLLPRMLKVAELRAQGKSPEEIKRFVADAFAKGMLMFSCCHPRLPEAAQVALVLVRLQCQRDRERIRRHPRGDRDRASTSEQRLLWRAARWNAGSLTGASEPVNQAVHSELTTNNFGTGRSFLPKLIWKPESEAQRSSDQLLFAKT